MENENRKTGLNSSGFRVVCKAEGVTEFRSESDSILVTVSQRIRHLGTQGMWDSVVVEGESEQDGTLVVRVLVFNPDWDERLQIACIRSRPDDPDSLTALGTNLDHLPS